MQRDLQDYIDRCLMLDTDIIIDGFKFRFVKDELIVVGIDYGTLSNNLDSGVFVFPECLGELKLDNENYRIFVDFCIKNRVHTLDFNNVFNVQIDNGRLDYSDVEIPGYEIKTIYANHWTQVCSMPGFATVENLYMDGISGYLSVGKTYINLRVLSAKNAKGIPSNGLYSINRLEELYIDSVSTIEYPGLKYMKYLKSFVAPNLDSCFGSFEDCESLEIVDLGKTSILHPNMFKNCKNLTTFKADYVTTIGSDCFCKCDKLDNLVLPRAKTLRRGAFRECDGLVTLTLGDLDRLEAGMFSRCWSLRHLIVNEHTTLKADSDTLNFTFRVKTQKTFRI